MFRFSILNDSICFVIQSMAIEENISASTNYNDVFFFLTSFNHANQST